MASVHVLNNNDAVVSAQCESIQTAEFLGDLPAQSLYTLRVCMVFGLHGGHLDAFDGSG